MAPVDRSHTTFYKRPYKYSSVLYHFRDIWSWRISWPWNLTATHPSSLCRIDTSLKSTDPAIDLSFCCWRYGCVFIRFSFSNFRRESTALQSFNVIQGRRKLYRSKTFPTIFSQYNCMPIFYRFRYITIYWLKIYAFFAIFLTRVSFEALARGVALGPRVRKLVTKTGLLYGENCMILWSLVLTHYQRVTDRQTDGHAAYDGEGRHKLLTKFRLNDTDMTFWQCIRYFCGNKTLFKTTDLTTYTLVKLI